MALDERLRYFIEAIWTGRSDTQQAGRDIERVGDAAESADRDLRTVGRASGQAGIDLRGLATTAATAGAGIAAAAFTAKKAWDALGEGAGLERSRDQFNRLATSIGSDADMMLEKLSEATGGIQTQAELIAGAGQIMSLGLADTQDGVVRLSRVVSELGWDMNQVILTFANNSTMRLDALGLSIEDVTGRMKELEAAGMDADKAFDMAVIEAGESKIELLGSAADTTAGQMKILETAIANLKDRALAGFAEALAPAIYLLSGQWANNEVKKSAANIEAAADRMQGLRDEAQRIQQILNDSNLSDSDFGLAQQRAYEEILRGIVTEMAMAADNADEFQEIVESTFGPEAIDGVNDYGEAWLTVGNIVDSVSHFFGQAQQEMRTATAETELLEQAGRRAEKAFREGLQDAAIEARAAIEGMVQEDSFEDGAGASLELNDAILRIAASAKMAEIGLTRVNQAAINLAAARADRADMFGGIDAGELGLGRVFGETFQFTRDLSEEIEDLEGKLAPLNEKMAEGGELTARQAERFKELTGALDEAKAAHGSLATGWDVDELMVSGAEAMLEAAAAGGATAQALYNLAGGSEAAGNALRDAAIQAKAIELGQAVAEGLDPGRALEELQNFIDNFDLDQLFEESRQVGSGESATERIRDKMLGYVEGIDAVAAETAKSAGVETDKVLTKAGELEGPWPYEIDLSGVNAAISRTQELINLIDTVDWTGTAPPGAQGGAGGPNATAAAGLHMTVPPGFPNDDYLIGVSSGEQVNITPPGQQTGGVMSAGMPAGAQPVFNIQVFAQQGMSAAAIVNQMRYQINQTGWQLRGV